MKNENKLDEMVGIMDELGKYVPCSKTQHTISVEGSEPQEQTLTSLHQLLVGGDQLTAARARGAIRQRQNSLTAMERLEGFIPVAEDWHAKVCLITVRNLLQLQFWLSRLTLFRCSGIGFSKRAQA